MSQAINLILSEPFLQRALVVGVFISLCSALLGVSLVLKRFSMIGDGLSHVGFGALAIACAANVAPLYFSLPIVVLAAFLLLRMNESGKIKGDAAIALISTGALAVGVMVTSMTKGMNVDIYNYMFGSILTMSKSDVAISVVLSAAVIALYTVFYNEIFAVTFDESFSKATGTKVSFYNMLIAALTAVTIVVGMRMMGALLISSLIIFPTVTSMRVCKSYKKVIITSCIVSLVCFFSGLLFSIRFEAPTGASVVCVNIFMLFVFSILRRLNGVSNESRLVKFKRPLIAVVLASSLALLSLPLFGNVKTYQKEKLSVVATSFASFDLARSIAKDNANVTMLLAPGEESHTFEPTPADRIKIEQCDIFVYGGGESDEWAKSIIDSCDGDFIVVRMMDVCENLLEEPLEGMEEEHDHDHEHEGHEEEEESEYDEHVWTSPKNAMKIAKTIKEALCQKDEMNKLSYEKAFDECEKQLLELDSEFSAFAKELNGKPIIVADRFPFKYLADEYSLNCYAAFPGCSAQSDASPTTIAFLNSKVRSEGIKTIYKVDLSKGNVASAISQATGARVETLYSCHVITAEDFEKGETYFSLMRRNLDALKSE